MQYRNFNGERDELKRRIEATEQEHYKITLEKKVAQAMKDDDRILAADERLAELETTLSVLYHE